MRAEDRKRERCTAVVQALLAITLVAVLASEVLFWHAVPGARQTVVSLGLLLAAMFASAIGVRSLDRQRRHEAEERRQSGVDRAGLAAAITQAAEAVIITDHEARILYVNPAFTRMTGYKSEEAIGRNPRLMKSGVQNAAFYSAMWNTIRAGKIWRGDVVNRRKDGSHYTEEMSITPVRDARGEITSYIAIKQDATDRRLGEDARRLLAAVVESSEDAILTHTLAGEIVTWNRGAQAMFGYSFEEVVSKSVSLIIPPERGDLPQRLAERLNRGETVPPFEDIAITKDGRQIDVSVALSTLKDRTGCVRAIAAIVRDIGARKQIEESRLLLASIVDSSSDAIYSVALDGRILSWNRGAEAIYGYRADEAIGAEFSLLAVPERIGDFGRILEQVQEGRGISRLETVRLAKDGRVVEVSLSVSPVRNAAGEVVAASFIAQDISLRKRAERELYNSERLFRTAFEHAPFGMCLSSSDRRLLRVNSPMCRILGYSEQELLALTWDAITHPDDLAKSRELMERLIREEVHCAELEKRYLHKNGQIVWARIRVSIVGDSALRSCYFVTHLEDITERKHAADAMRESEDRVRLLLDSTAEAIYGIDLAGNCTFANAACLRILGYPDLQSVLGRNMHDLIHHTRADGRRYPVMECRIFKAFLSGEGSHVDDEVLWRADGTSFAAEYWSYPMRKNGMTAGSVVAFLDITERKRTQEALRRSEENYRLLVDSIPDIVWVADDEGHTAFITPNCEAIYGYAQDEIYQSGVWFERIHPDDAKEVREAYKRFLAEGLTFSEEYRIHKKDGSWIWIEDKAISSYERDGRRFTVGRASDISARRQGAEELQRAKEAAESGNRAKSRFLANMSHEIRTPMNGVIGMTRLLLETPLSSEQRRYAELVRTSGETLMALINHILDLSKIEAGKMLLESVDFDLRAMLESATEMLALQAGAKGLELTCLMMPETPSHLRGDPGRLRQVIINLAANAVKFTERGEVSIRVEPVRDDGRHAALRFTIADTGIGINKERARALFSPFVQADESTTRKFGGTGLGLAISKQLVGMMGGEIGFESEEGKGSTFWFTAVLEKQLEARGVESAGLCKVKALIVDGSRSNRLMVSTLLRSWGCRPSEAADAETAMALLRDAARAGDPFHVALLDKGQPGVGGEELAGRIVADSSLCGTVLLLMVPLGERDFGSQTHSFAAQIRKPVLETRLREVLKAALCNQKPAGDGASVACFQTKPRPAQARSQARILLAEDNLINQEVALALLRQLGYMTAAVSNGAQAVKALKSARYDVVLMDCEMPELDGYEATRLIRDPATGALDPKIPIIAVTAGAMAGDRERCLQAGMDDYLSKPVEAQEMAQVIAKWIGRKDGVEEAFDGAAFLKRLSGDQALAETIAKRFLGDIPKQLCNLRKHIEEGDATKAGRQAHTLKGAAATVSANALRAIAFEAEQAAKAGKLEEVAELLPRVEEQVERFRAALMEWGHSSING